MFKKNHCESVREYKKNINEYQKHFLLYLLFSEIRSNNQLLKKEILFLNSKRENTHD